MRVNPPFLGLAAFLAKGIITAIYRDLKTLKAIPYVELAPTHFHLSSGMSQGQRVMALPASYAYSSQPLR